VTVGDIELVDSLVTNRGADEGALQAMRERGVDVVTV
jgi:hypothetical protein